MQRFFVALAACLACVFLAAPAQAEKLRIALQKTGTLAWELEIMRAESFDDGSQPRGRRHGTRSARSRQDRLAQAARRSI